MNQIQIFAAVACAGLTSLCWGNPATATSNSLTKLPGQDKITCTQVPRDKWMDQEVFKKKLSSHGYKLMRFKISKGNCYELYGFDSNKELVEMYFDPLNGNVVKRFQATQFK